MMERSLKERIIGAIVLVAVVVLVVPVFLDGPPGDGEIISERVLLPGQSEDKTQTVVLDRDREEPVPSQQTAKATPTPEPVAAAEPPSAIATSSEPAGEPETAVTALATKAQPAAEEPAPTAVQTTSSATGMWAVQLGSFSSQENAERLAADLRKQGFAAFLSQLSTSAGQLHRVRIGPQKDRESAEAMAARLAKAGHKGTVLPHP